MRYQTPSNDDLLQVIRNFLKERADQPSDEALRAMIAGTLTLEPGTAARLVQQHLQSHGVRLKYTHALDLVANLRGLRGRFDHAGEPVYRLAFVLSEDSRELESHDFAQLLARVADAIGQYLGALTQPTVFSLRLSTSELLLTAPAGAFPNFMASLKAPDGAPSADVFNRACERIRRIIESASVPCWCDGAQLAVIAAEHPDKRVELVAEEEHFELARGGELHVLAEVDRLIRGFVDAAADGRWLRAEDHQVAFALQWTVMEPNFGSGRLESASFDFAQLVRRYRHLRRRLDRPLNEAFAPSTSNDVAGAGFPRRIAISARKVEATRTDLGISVEDLAQRCNWTVAELDAALTSDSVELSTYLQLALSLELKDFNRILRRRTASEAQPVNADALQSILHNTDRVRFAFGEFESAPRAMLDEAAQNLAASRLLRSFSRAGMMGSELGDVAFSSDAEEFLSVGAEQNAEVRVTVEPMFAWPNELGLGDVTMPFELPALGWQAVLFVLPHKQAKRAA